RNFPARAGETASVVFKGSPSLDDPAVRAQIDQTLNQLRQVPRVIAVRSPFDDGNSHQLSKTQPIAYADIQFRGKTGDHLPDSVRNQVSDIVSAAKAPNLQAELSGDFQQGKPPATFALGLLAAIVILMVVFGSVLAMGLPIMNALFGLGVGL